MHSRQLNGLLYGTSAGGGNQGCNGYGCGTLFSFNPTTRVEKVLYSFCTQQNCTDGAIPLSGLLSKKGELIGTTFAGGTQNCLGGCGTAYEVDPTAGAEKVIYAFCKQASCDDGEAPLAGLIDVSGTLYGTTQDGGTGQGLGTAYAIDPKSGTETVLYSFCSEQNCADGQNPNVALLDLNGTLYGTTTAGGGNCGCGTVFSIDPNTGAEDVLHDFGSGDGQYPDASLIAVNGLLYGTTDEGGVAGCGGSGCGTVFSIDPNTGVEKVLHSFCSQKNCSDGANPFAGLIDVEGTLYGTTLNGGGTGCGGPGCGTVYSVDPNTGAETVLYSFCRQQNCADGANPGGGLIAVRGTLYGTTSLGGIAGCGGSGCGTVFSLRRKR